MFVKFFFQISVFSLVIIFSISSFAKTNDIGSFEMLSPQTFDGMPKELQKEYLEKVRKTWLEFEKKYPKTMSETAEIENEFWQNFFVSTAHAASRNYCIIGGNMMGLINNSCPTKLKPCTEKSDGFRCGAIFGGICINRTPISNISERCYKKGNKKIPDTPEYKQILLAMSMDFAEVCSDRSPSNTSDGCKFLAKRMADVTNELNFKIATSEGEKENLPSQREVTPSPTSNAEKARERRTTATANLGTCTYNGGPTKKLQIVPTFDLLAGETCTFDNNQKILEALTKNGCENKKATRKLLSTRFKSVGSGRVDGQTNTVNAILTKVELLERKSATEAIFNVRMVKYDISKTPGQLQQITQKIKQSGDKFYWLRRFGISQEVTIKNTTRTFEMSGIEGYASVYDSMMRMSQDCLLLEDINTLQANGTSIVPSINSSGGGNSAGSI